MISYFIKAGDGDVSDLFAPYVWKDQGFEKVLKGIMSNKSYGDDLDLLLIKFYVEGQFDVDGPEQPKVGNYSMKNKDIDVAITARREDFHDRSDHDRRKFIVSSTLKAIDLIQAKLSKKKLSIDFNQLRVDAQTAGNKYIGSSK